MKCMDCGKHSMVWCSIGENILKSELSCQLDEDKVVIKGATKTVMAETEAPAWCPLKKEAKHDP